MPRIGFLVLTTSQVYSQKSAMEGLAWGMGTELPAAGGHWESEPWGQSPQHKRLHNFCNNNLILGQFGKN